MYGWLMKFLPGFWLKCKPPKKHHKLGVSYTRIRNRVDLGNYRSGEGLGHYRSEEGRGLNGSQYDTLTIPDHVNYA